MLYFLEKSEKIAAALGTWPPNPVGLWWLGTSPPDLQVVTLTQLDRWCSDFSPSLKLRPIISYLIDGYRARLAKLALLSQTPSCAAGHNPLGFLPFVW